MVRKQGGTSREEVHAGCYLNLGGNGWSERRGEVATVSASRLGRGGAAGGCGGVGATLATHRELGRA